MQIGNNMQLRGRNKALKGKSQKRILPENGKQMQSGKKHQEVEKT
jgi:hypothetical protein